MSNSDLTDADVAAILKLLTAADHLDEFRIRYGEIEISYSRHGGVSTELPARRAQSPAPATAARETAEPSTRAPPASASSSVLAKSASASPSAMEGVAVTSPMFGTFYRAPAPGAPPFVQVGQAVDADSVVCIIEVMKLMNSVTAGVRGTVRQILVDDSEPVELGQALVIIEPA